MNVTLNVKSIKNFIALVETSKCLAKTRYAAKLGSHRLALDLDLHCYHPRSKLTLEKTFQETVLIVPGESCTTQAMTTALCHLGVVARPKCSRYQCFPGLVNFLSY